MRRVEREEEVTRPPLPPSSVRGRLREAHAHIAEYGRSLSMVSFAACASRQTCLEMLRAERDSRRDGWFMGQAMRVEAWDEPRYPSRAELDAIFGDRPCVVMSFDYHAAVANTAALAAAGLTPTSPDPVGGLIVRDAKGEATGLLLESAAKKVWNAAPEPTRAQRKEHVRLALRALGALGFVEVHDLLAQGWLGPILAELHDAGELTQRVEVYVPFVEVERAHGEAKAWARDGVRLAGGKIFADGTLNSGTAWMLSPYREPIAGMECGKALWTVGEMSEAMRKCGELGLGLAVHAIGDGAVRACLDAWEEIEEKKKGPLADARSSLRIEHCEIIDSVDVPRFAELGVIASVQPCHLLYDIEVLRRQLPHRLDQVMPVRELMESGLVPGKTLVFGSDVPIVRAEPEDSIRAAVDRRREGMGQGEAIAWGQRIRAEDAWAAFSVGG